MHLKYSFIELDEREKDFKYCIIIASVIKKTNNRNKSSDWPADNRYDKHTVMQVSGSNPTACTN